MENVTNITNENEKNSEKVETTKKSNKKKNVADLKKNNNNNKAANVPPLNNEANNLKKLRNCSLEELKCALSPAILDRADHGACNSWESSYWPLTVTKDGTAGGNGFLAKRAIVAGETTLRAAPYAWVISDEWLRNACAWCTKFVFSKRWKLGCEDCHMAFYCSEECYTRGHYSHRLLCPYFIQIYKYIPKAKTKDYGSGYRSLVRLVVTVLVRAHVERTYGLAMSSVLFGAIQASYAGFEEPLPSELEAFTQEKLDLNTVENNSVELTTCVNTLSIDLIKDIHSCEAEQIADIPTFLDVKNMVTNRDILAKETISMFEEIYNILTKFLSEPILMDQSTVIDILCAEECNSFGYWDDTGTMYGYGIVPLASFFNHSCNPTVCKFGLGPDIVFRAIRNIEMGDEIFLSYTWVTDPKATRQKDLMKYMFTCACPRCSIPDTEVDSFPTDYAHLTCGGLICPSHPKGVLPIDTDAGQNEPFCSICFRAVELSKQRQGWKTTRKMVQRK